MIIAISGKIGSGKDTVGNIIRELDDIVYPAISTITKRNWQIVKYADALKDIVCILTGCTREQLEDIDFKNTELGEEWWYFKGRNGSLIPFKNYKGKRSSEDLIKLTPRKILQLVGTECGRNIIHPNIWVNALMSKYKPKGISKEHWNKTKDIHYKNQLEYPNWIITDVRFPNEAEAIKDKGGIIIRVNRFIKPNCKACNMKNVKEEDCKSCIYYEEILESIHESETALDDYTEFDYVIENDGSIEELTEKVREILIKERII